MLSRRASFIAFGAALLGSAGLAGCATPAAVVEDRLTLVAIVETVDQATRDVLLRGPEGRLFTVKAGEEVRNLAQLRAGDRVRVIYYQAVAVQLAPPGAAAAKPARDSGAMRTALGDRPGVAGYEAQRVRVRIDGVDRSGPTVTFTGPNRATRTLTVREPAMQAFVRRLNPGDEVEIDYVEAVAVGVEPMPPG